MIIKNKLESINKISELNLNKFPERLFRENEETEVQEFLERVSLLNQRLVEKSSHRKGK